MTTATYPAQSADGVKTARALVRYFDTVMGTDYIDWCGKYHTWLREQGIPSETAEGWWSDEALEEENIDAFVQSRTN